MSTNIFMGEGFFGSRRIPVVGPALGQYGYSSGQLVRPMSPMVWGQSQYSWPPRSQAVQSRAFTRPTSQPMAVSGSDVHCYYCEGLPEFPTYWLSESQAEQWNRDRDARCSMVPDGNCQQKYNQLQPNIRPSGFNALNFPSATTYAPMMSGRIPVQNPELLG